MYILSYFDDRFAWRQQRKYRMMDYTTQVGWREKSPTPFFLASAFVFKFSAAAGWPCLFIDERSPAVVAAAGGPDVPPPFIERPADEHEEEEDLDDLNREADAAVRI
jgi:hypothetical protein